MKPSLFQIMAMQEIMNKEDFLSWFNRQDFTKQQRDQIRLDMLSILEGKHVNYGKVYA